MTASADLNNHTKTLAFTLFCIWPSLPSWWDVNIECFHFSILPNLALTFLNNIVQWITWLGGR